MGALITACSDYDKKIADMDGQGRGQKGGPQIMNQIQKEKTLLDPKYMQVKHLTEKVCTARCVCVFVKWRRAFDSYFNSFFPRD